MNITSAVLVAEAKARINNVPPEEAHKAIENGTSTLLDLRERDELDATGTFPQAIHIPRGMLEFAVDPGHPSYKAGITPDMSLILACASGARSALATETLHQLGFSDVSNLEGGFKAWVEQGLPINEPSGKQD
jgi:rhodanese-related sulfurtransferase